MGVIYDPILDKLRTKDAAGGGGGEWTDIDSATVTTPVTSIDFEDVFTDAYNVYELLVYNGSFSSTGQLVLQLGSGGTPSYVAAGYAVNGLNVTTNSALYASIVSNVLAYITWNNTSRGAGFELNANMLFYNLRAAGVEPSWRGWGIHTIPAQYTNNVKLDVHGVLDDSTTIFDHLRIKHSSTGNLDAGTYILRGKNV